MNMILSKSDGKKNELPDLSFRSIGSCWSAFFFFFCCISLGALNAKPLQIEVHAKSAVLMNLDTGAVLFEKNPYDSAYPASIKHASSLIRFA